jgi:hypothetical protein
MARKGRKVPPPNGKVFEKIRHEAGKHGLAAVRALAEILADEDSSSLERLKAIEQLLDRAIGKPPVPVTGEGGEGPVTLQVITGVTRAPCAIIDEKPVVELTYTPEPPAAESQVAAQVTTSAETQPQPVISVVQPAPQPPSAPVRQRHDDGSPWSAVVD